MLLPNKLFTYSESAISKFPIILTALSAPLSVSELYNLVSDQMTGISEYLDILDCLFALGKIRFDRETGVLHYVV